MKTSIHDSVRVVVAGFVAAVVLGLLPNVATAHERHRHHRHHSRVIVRPAYYYDYGYVRPRRYYRYYDDACGPYYHNHHRRVIEFSSPGFGISIRR